MRNKRLNNNYPGAQVQVLNFNWVFFILCSLIIFFLACTVYSVIQENISSSSSLVRYFSLKLLDTKTACTIFVTLIGLLLVRHHFVMGFKPRIIYETHKARHSIYLEQEDSERVWQVKIRNVGLGAALFLDYSFRVGIKVVKERPYDLAFSEVVSKLKDAGFYLENDFFLCNITKGFALQSKEDKIVLEMKLPKAFELSQLDIKFIFKGFLGGKYRKEVYLIPRIGIYNKDEGQKIE